MRQCNARSHDNVVAVQECVSEQSRMSIAPRSQALNDRVTSLWRILRKDLALRLYKIVFPQELKPSKHFKPIRSGSDASWLLPLAQENHVFG